MENKVLYNESLSLRSRRVQMLKKVSIFYLTSLIVVALLWFVLDYVEFVNVDWWIVLTFLLIGMYSTIYLAKSVIQNGVSLAVIHWFFVIIFFFLVPLGQYVGNLFRFYTSKPLIITANLLILIWCIIFSAGYHYIYVRLRYMEPLLNKFFIDSLYAKQHRLYLLTLVSTLLAIYLVFTAGDLRVFATRATLESSIGEFGGFGPKALIILYYVRPFIFWVFIFLLSVWVLSCRKPRLPYYFWLILAFFAAIIINNPLSTPRFYAFALLFGLLIILTYRRPTGNLLYMAVLFLGLMFSPVVNVFRHLYTIEINQLLSFKVDPAFFFVGDFDTYENFTYTIDYVNTQGLLLGKQLLGPLLFFIPRSVWQAKPIGSMSMVAQEYLIIYFDVQNFNLAMPMIAEWFINFHVLGVIFAAFFYGAFTAFLDKRYQWSFLVSPSDKQITDRVDFYRILYPIFLGFFLFHLRGDFMSSYAYSVGCLLAFFSAYLILKLG